MAESQVDGGSEQGTATGANGSASEAQGVQQPSFDAAKLQASLDALVTGQKELEARVNGLQGVKDKTKKELSGLKGKIAEYENLKEQLGSSESAMEQLELREQLSSMSQTLQELKGSVSTPAPGKEQGGAGTLAQVIRDNQLDANDAAVAKILADNKGNDLTAAVEIGRYAAAKASRPSGDPTASTSISSGSGATAENVDTLTREYQEKMRAATGNRTEIIRLRNEYKEKGVNVYGVDFS